MPSGGKRKGSGRKKNPDKKKNYTTKLRPDQILWLQEQENASEILDIAIRKLMLQDMVTNAPHAVKDWFTDVILK